MPDGITLVAGIAMLLFGGAFLVRGASEIATGFGVSPLVVGLTVVGFGTSAPELVINVLGAAEGATDLAFGNVIGSNISNLALVLGATALLAPITMQSQLVRREVPLLLLATTIAAVLALDGPLEQGEAVIGRSDSIVLLLIFCIFVYIVVLDFIRARQEDPLLIEVGHYPLLSQRAADPWRWPMAIGGCALLFLGGKLTIQGGVGLASGLEVPETIVGLFVVAIGTSLPELVTSIMAAIRREPDLALGNIVGSNLFNTLVVLPASGMVLPVAVPAGGLLDLAISWILVALLIPVFFVGQARLGRVFGGGLLLAYVIYAVFRTAGAV
jgi:cation:H+ antiporter